MFKRYGIPTIYLLIVFLGGLAVGVSGYRFYEIKTVSANPPLPVSPEKWKEHHIADMKSRLHLTDSQSKQLGTILDETRAEYREVMERSRPDMERIQAEQYSRVKAILTPDQLPAYDKFHAERESHRREMDRKMGAPKMEPRGF
jgi:Spy/CpxP family protein refolding chaperone